MSDVVDRIRRELQQRLESTRAAAQEHERVRSALEALEQAVKPLEKVTRRAAAGASKRARPSRAKDGAAATGSDAAPAGAGGRETVSPSKPKAEPAAKPPARRRASAKPARQR